MEHLAASSAGENEKAVYQAFLERKDWLWEWLNQELYTGRTPYNELDKEFQAYESYIVNDLLMTDTGILSVDTQDATYQQWTTEETLSLSEFLEYAISQNLSLIHI